MLLWGMERWSNAAREGGGWRGQSFTAAAFHHAYPRQAGSWGANGLQIANICMCLVHEEKIVSNAIKVSFTSCGASTLSAILDASSQPLSASVFKMLRAQYNKWIHSFTSPCIPLFLSFSPCFLYLIFNLTKRSKRFFTSLSVRSYGYTCHVVHRSNIKKNKK